MDTTDQKLLSLLRENARASTSALARDLGLSRSTVQDRINRLESRGIVAGYTVRLGEETEKRRVTAHVMVSVSPKAAPDVTNALRKMDNMRSLCAISGEYDMIAILEAGSTEEVDTMLDAIGALDGVTRTNSSIVLSTKFQR